MLTASPVCLSQQRGVPEVEAAEQLAHEEDVDVTAITSASQRRVLRQRRKGVGKRRPQVGEAAQLLANTAAGRPRAACPGRERVELVVADGAEQHRVRSRAQVIDGSPAAAACRFGRDGHAADQGFGEADVVTRRTRPLGPQDVPTASRVTSGTDAVAGEDCDVQLHAFIPLSSCV